ncbi:MAG: M23 family metallopeptidase [Deltaproteobacteria bacterium]|nr:M23 family metallopeptidase [Deltaproteobacteria bacterium]
MMSYIDANAQSAYRAADRGDNAALKKANTALESHFFKQILKESQIFKGDGSASAGFARDQWVDSIADSLAESMDLGLGLDTADEKGKSAVQTALYGDGPTADFLAMQALNRSSAINTASSLGSSSAMSSMMIADHADAASHSHSKNSSQHIDIMSLVVEADAARVTSPYGDRADPFSGKVRHHHGVDIGAKHGSAVHSATPGKVIFAGERGGYGNTVVVKHTDGTRTLYAHLSEINVKKGDNVALGETLGEVGSTGRSTGPHLHLEVRRGKAAVDPFAALKHYRKSVDVSCNPANLSGGSQ